MSDASVDACCFLNAHSHDVRLNDKPAEKPYKPEEVSTSITSHVAGAGDASKRVVAGESCDHASGTKVSRNIATKHAAATGKPCGVASQSQEIHSIATKRALQNADSPNRTKVCKDELPAMLPDCASPRVPTSAKREGHQREEMPHSKKNKDLSTMSSSESDWVCITIHDISGEVLFADRVAMWETAQSLLLRVCQINALEPALATLVHDDKVLACGNGTCHILGHQLPIEDHTLTLIRLSPPCDYDKIDVCDHCDEVRCVYVWSVPDDWGNDVDMGQVCIACGKPQRR